MSGRQVIRNSGSAGIRKPGHQGARVAGSQGGRMSGYQNDTKYGSRGVIKQDVRVPVLNTPIGVAIVEKISRI